ncbi:hypothetical protein CYK37_00035 [Mesorhizobium loti]|nr:rhamnan synthesis F family protein [Mesorhizobium loti]PLP60747.1 hypothetical protein CYK37_00035 [Mesorhizobium loti]
MINVREVDIGFSEVLSVEGNASETCCYVHLFHDVVAEIFDLLGKVALDAELLLSVVEGSPAHARLGELPARLRNRPTRSRVILVKNAGSDVIPFLLLNSAGFFRPYRLVCKTHGKRTAHKVDLGGWWFRTMLGETLADGLEVVQACARSDLTPCLTGARSLIITEPLFWRDNIESVRHICSFFDVEVGEQDAPFFFAGTSFWVSQEFLTLLRCLDEFPLEREDFAYGADGAFGHAFERAIPFIAVKRGELVLDSAGAVYREGLVRPGLVHDRFRAAFM